MPASSAHAAQGAHVGEVLDRPATEVVRVLHRDGRGRDQVRARHPGPPSRSRPAGSSRPRGADHVRVVTPPSTAWAPSSARTTWASWSHRSSAPGGTSSADPQLVAQRPGGHEQPGLMAQQLRDPGLEGVDGGVLAVHVVTDHAPRPWLTASRAWDGLRYPSAGRRHPWTDSLRRRGGGCAQRHADGVRRSAVAAALLLSGCTQLQRITDSLGSSDAELLAAVSLTEADAADGVGLPALRGRRPRCSAARRWTSATATSPARSCAAGATRWGSVTRRARPGSAARRSCTRRPQDAEQAMAELEKAREECPDRAGRAPGAGPRRPGVGVRSPLPTPTGPRSPASPVRPTSSRRPIPRARRGRSTATYLQRGRMILALYSDPARQPRGDV